ncbi:MAG: large subunit ribosomal protein L23 [Nitriliruptoraceae bacterium]|jgi:large subunit ribosomal protein L23
MKDPRDIIRRPVITEKSYGLMDSGMYTFVVDPRSNKTEIKIAIEKIFDVKVVKIATQNRRGKVKRRGYTTGKRPDIKRAIVTLAAGDEIDFDAGI